jgi:hypothetical protein
VTLTPDCRLFWRSLTVHAAVATVGVAVLVPLVLAKWSAEAAASPWRWPLTAACFVVGLIAGKALVDLVWGLVGHVRWHRRQA